MNKQDIKNFLTWLLEENDGDYVLFHSTDGCVYSPFSDYVIKNLENFSGNTFLEFLNWLTTKTSNFRLIYNDGWELFDLVENGHHFPIILENWNKHLEKEKFNE